MTADLPVWSEDANDLATYESNVLARRFPMLERDAIHSEMWVWLLTHQEHVAETLAEDTGKTKLAFYLKTEGRRYCLHEKARIEGYSVSDLHFYTTAQLYDMLPTVFSYEDWQPTGLGDNSGMPSGTVLHKEGGNLVAMLVDVASALTSLREHDYNVIVWRFKYDWSDEQLALELECTPATANKKVQRSVKALQNALGGSSPFVEHVGTRSVMSNAAARARTSNQVEG